MNSVQKTGLLILPTSIALIVLSYIYSVTASSHVIDCNSQTMSESASGDCVECPKCPPVESCSPGYSCQPDDDGGEEQKYPPTTATDWVKSLGCDQLADVPLDDPRWADREEGDVYAQEGSNCLAFYWPEVGVAKFGISATLSNPAKWHDYLLSGVRPPGSGHFNIRDGKQGIHFNAAGGGMTVFIQSDDQPHNDNFFTPYFNPQQAKLPADGIYPLGQRMSVSAYSTSDSQRRTAATAGFTADGPHYHGRGPESNPYTLQWTLAKSLGMKGYYRFHSIGATNWNDVVALMKTPETRARLTTAITGMINDVLSNPELNDFVDAWYGFQEEIITRSSPPLTEQRNFHRFVYAIIKKMDTVKQRPYYVSERRDSSASNMAGNACFQDGVMKQDALIADSGYTSDIEVRGIMRQWGIEAVKTASDADKRCPSYTGRPRAAIATLSSAEEPTNPAHRNEAWLRRIITYDVYTQLAMGIDGINVFSYAWRSHSTAALQQRLYNEILGGMIKKGLGKVFLWGQDRDDVTKTITSGPKTMTWSIFNRTYTIPSVDMRNIQYGAHRYILQVNNTKETVGVRLSGIPTDAKVIDLISGSNITPTIPALGVRMYRILQ